jgi:hypothetical protein
MRICRRHSLIRTAEPQVARSGSRRGTIIAWSIFGLMFAGVCTALVVNSLWISGVRADSHRCLEAAALAAGKSLLSDDLLRAKQYPIEQEWRRQRAQTVAIHLATQYRRLQHVPRLQRRDVEFLTTQRNQGLPAAVRVSYGQSGPAPRFPLFLSGLTGVSTASVRDYCLVAMLNSPLALRPTRQVSIPMLPAYLVDAESGSPTSWVTQIERFEGADRITWNAENNRVEQGADGLPELTLVVDWRPTDRTCELLPMLLNRDCSTEEMAARFLNGVSRRDLEAAGLVEIAFPARCAADDVISCDIYAMLTSVIGKPRVLCIAETSGEPTSEHNSGSDDPNSLQTLRPVAARVLQVKHDPQGATVVTLQPCVMSTVTAVMEPNGQPNRYIYDVRLRN